MNNESIKSVSKAVTSELNDDLRYFFSILVLVLSNYEYSIQTVLKKIRGLTVESSETICLKMTDITYTKGKIYLFILAKVTCVIFHNAMLQNGNRIARRCSSRKV